jgi:N-acetylmuramoyl-L-alanine amidase
VIQNRYKEKKTGMTKYGKLLLLLCVCWLGLGTAMTANAQEERPVRVVIDPGHGGENLGAQYEDYTEKEMTMIVAQAMKEELEQYQGIEVYLTREGDAELSLKERAEYAAQMDADFLFCLHFNMSEYHTLFGAECWVSAFGENYSKGYSFASAEMELLTEKGLYSRGIKTRLNDKGTDYYGIIRQAVELDVPCVLIEHCHLDQANDQPYYDHGEKLREFGRLDATAVAQYFGLYSETLQKDFRTYQRVEVAVPENVMRPDETEPEECTIELVEQDEESGDVTLRVTASDAESGMLYYTYSYDGGQHYSELIRWPDRTADSFTVTLEIPLGTAPVLSVNAYNGYDLYTTSNELSLPAVEPEVDPQEELLREETPVQELPAEEAEPAEEKTAEEAKNGAEIGIIPVVCLILLAGLAVSLIILRSGIRQRGHRRRRRRR